jgi:predicted Zn finger-like uncharacterized protein
MERAVVITCEECTTRFQLDDSRVPETGVRVRCSRCQHSFFVKRTPESGVAVVESAVSRALEEDSTDAVSDSAGELQSAVESSAAEREPAEHESDWEFNHDDAPGHDAALAQAQEEVDDLLAGGSSIDEEDAAEQTNFGPAGDVEGEIAELLGEPSEPAEIEPAAGLSGCDEAAKSQASDLAAAESDALELADAPVDCIGVDEDSLDDAMADHDEEPDTGFDLAESPAADLSQLDEPMMSERAEPSAPPGRMAEERLGSPDEWDFFADDSAADGGAAPRTVLAQIQVGPAGSFDSAPSHEDQPMLESEPSQLAGWVVRAGAGVGWLATASLMVSLLMSGLAPRTTPTATSGTGAGLVDVQAHRIDNAVAGQLVLIEAQLPAEQALSRSLGTRFAVQLLDSDGVVVAQDAASFGPALTQPELRESAPARLRAVLEQAAVAAAWRPVTAAMDETLHAVLAETPAAATHFEIVQVPVEPAATKIEPADARRAVGSSS